MIIDLPRFLANERPTWSELERALGQIEEQPDRRMTLQEVTRLHFLYQKVSADLVQLHTFGSEGQVQRYLEALVARAYGEIHGGRARSERWRPFRWFGTHFPLVFRRHFRAFVISCLVTLFGMAFGGLALMVDDEAKSALIPAQFSPLLGDPAERVAEEEASAKENDGEGHAMFASSLMVNNIQVSIKCMAFGMTWGIGTLILLFHNGVILGLIAIDYIRAGQTVFLLGWLMPHGVIEIPCVLIAGQAGLVLAGALLGRGSRLGLAERLRQVSGDLATLIGGVAVMLVWAGIVESFLSQYHQPVIPYSVKIAFGALELAGLIWFLAPRRSTPATTLPA